MTQNFIWCDTPDFRDQGSMEYYFIAITPRSTDPER